MKWDAGNKLTASNHLPVIPHFGRMATACYDGTGQATKDGQPLTKEIAQAVRVGGANVKVAAATTKSVRQYSAAVGALG